MGMIIKFHFMGMIIKFHFISLQVYQKFPAGQDRRILHGTMAAALGAPILVVLLDLVSLLILFYKVSPVNRSFAYAIILSDRISPSGSPPRPC